MTDIINYRGPDYAGHYVSGNLGFGHRRLSIIDISDNAHQPMLDVTERYCIVYNGEIYNFLELRSYLVSKGFSLKSKSDTEVLLYLFIDLGPAMLDLLNGMFAIAIWDNQSKDLFIAKDRLGVKPLYYSSQSESFVFSSEPKALFSFGISQELDSYQMEEIVLYRSVAGEKTIFKNVKKLLPGHYLVIKDGRIEQVQWWNLSNRVNSISNSYIPKNVFTWFEETLNSSIKYRTISDVPVGVLLSGGLDSSSIAASLYNQSITKIKAFNLSFSNNDYDESHLARLTSEKFDMDFHQIYLENNELVTSLEDSIWAHDEPLMHQNDPHLLAISRFAKPFVSVLLSGEGADELLGGYVRYKPLIYRNSRKLISNSLKYWGKIYKVSSRIEKLMFYNDIELDTDRVLLNSCSLYPQQYEKYGIHLSPYCSAYRNNILNESINLYPKDLVRQAMYLDLNVHLQSLLERNDRMTMFASIECREPFLDYRLVEMCSSLPSNYLFRGRKGKYVLFKSFSKYLPQQVNKYRKWGFGVPWEYYFRNNEYFKNALNDLRTSEILNFPVFRKIQVGSLIGDFLKGNDKDSTFIRQLVFLHLWYSVYFKKLSQ